MAFSVSYIFQAIDKFSGTANRIGRSMDKVNNKVKNVSRSLAETGQKFKNFGRNMLPASVGIGALAGFALNASAKMESLTVSFETMLGSAEKATKLVRNLRDFAAKTPFQLEGIGKATKQLLSFGVTENKITDRLQMLGDIAAGANIPLTDMAAIFGKAKAKGKVMTEELLQLSDRGIPIIDVLAKGFGVTKDKIFEMASKSQISFDTLVKAMGVMTTKGGIFFNQMERQSETLGGIFSTLKDNIFDALVSIGDTIVETFDLKNVLKDTIVRIQELTKAFNNFVKTNPKLAKFLFIITAVAAALAPLLILIGFMASGVAALGTAFAVIGGMIGAISLPVIAVIAAVGLLVFALLKLRENWVTVSNVIGGTIESILINFELLKDRVMSIFDSIKNGFTAAFDAISTKITSLQDIAVKLFEESTIGKLMDLAGNLIGGGEAKASIDINVNDPGQVLGSVDTSKTGSGVEFNVGQNMATQ